MTAPLSGQPADLRAFHERYRPIYIRWSELYLGNRADAEEAVDQAFEQIAMNWTAILSRENPTAYAWKVMKNRTIDHARARARRPIVAEDAVFEAHALHSAPDPIKTLEDSLALHCPASSSWQVLGLGKVGDDGVGGADVDVVGTVPGECLVGADGVVLDPVVLGVTDEVQGVGDLLEEELLVLQ